MKFKWWWLIAMCAFAPIAGACSGDSAGTGHRQAQQDTGVDAGADTATVACVPNPDLVAQKSACVRDEQCPCGTHCWLGQCQATCQADADCADGQYCDDFGQCRDAQDASKVALRSNVDQGRLQARRPVATLSAARPVTSILVRAADGPIDHARVVAGDGLLVAVTDGTEPVDSDFAQQVNVDQHIERDGTVTIWTERDPANTTDGLGTNEVTLYDSGGHSTSVSVTDPDAAVGSVPAQPDLAGVYTGLARLVARGSTGGHGDNMAAPARAEAVPLTAKIYDTGTDMRLVLVDKLHVLHPQGTWIGTMSADAQTLDLPSFDALSLDQIALSNSQVVASPTDVKVDGDPTDAHWDGVLRVGFDLVYQGVSDTDGLPTARWKITLSRTGDLPSGDTAPDAQQDAQLAYDTAQEADTPFNAETGFATIAATYPYLRTKWQTIRKVADRTLSGGSLNVCAQPFVPFVSDDDRAQYYRAFYRSVYADVIAHGVPWGSGNTDAEEVFNTTLIWQPITGQTATLADIAASTNSYISEIFGGISPQNTVLYGASVSLASPFYDPTVGNFGTDMYAPPITMPDGTVVKDALPCDIDLTDAPDTIAMHNSNFGYNFTFDVPNHDFDFCQTAADRLDCQIVDVTNLLTPDERNLYPSSINNPNGINMFTVDIYPESANYHNKTEARVPNVRFTKVCVPPPIPSRCAEGIACESSDPGGSGTVDLQQLSTSSQSAASGDLACGNTGRTFGYGMDQTDLPADTLVDDCVADSQAMETPLPAPSGTTDADKLRSMGWYDDHGCFNPVQLVSGVGNSTIALRYWRQSQGTHVTTADLVAMRLLQKWTDAHALIASEATHSTTFAHLDTQNSTVDQLETRLHQSLRAWRFLLHPRVATALLSLSPKALRNPDYRQSIDGGNFTDKPYNRQSGGLVVSMAELLDAQVQLGNAIAEQYALQGATAEPDSLSELLQTYQVADALIQALDRRSRDVDGTYGGWEGRFRSVERRLMGGWIKLSNRVDGMLNGRNPLGIEDVDLPLYFREIHNDAVSRFGAVSEFLLGPTNDSQAWAASLVRDASDAYATAKQAYLDEQSRLLNQQADETAKATRVDNVKTDFGLQMIDMCGSEAFGGASADGVYDRIDPDTFDASTCWYRSERPECSPDGVSGGPTEDKRRQAGIEYNLCTQALSADQPTGAGKRPVRLTVNHWGHGFRYFAYVPGWQFDSPVLKALQKGMLEKWTSFAAVRQVMMKLEVAACVQLPVGSICAPTRDGQAVPLLFDPDAPNLKNPCINTDVPNFPGILPRVEKQPDGSWDAVCEPDTSLGFAGPTLRVSLSDAALADLRKQAGNSVISAQVASKCRNYVPDHDPAPMAAWAQAPQSCYTGSVGAQVYSTRTLVTDIELARDELQQSNHSYRIAMQSCFLQQQGDAQLQQAEQKFNDEMNKLGDAKLAADIVSTWASSAGDCLGTLSGAEKPWGYGLAGGACGAYAVGAVADTVSQSLANDMDRAERAHEATTMAIEQATDEARCFKEAELELVGVRSAYLDIKRAKQELTGAYLDTQQTIDSLTAQYQAALGDVQSAEDSAVLTPAQSPWYNEELTTYGRKLRLARRAAYLAVRAVEYEYQMSSSYRSDVLQAQTPVELEQVLTELRQVANTNSVQGARPSDLTQIVSLKDHLLQLGDRSDAPAGWQTLTPTERFRKMLVDPKYEVYKDGVFVGRRIPFEIAPLSVLDRGEFQGIPIVSDNSCAERLWSVNVTFEGPDGEVLRGINPAVNLEIRKRNTFYSNYCDGTQGDFQVACVRPSRNLFREPGVGEGISGVTGQSEVDGFSKARIQARANISPQDFASASYTDGSSTELAARGLFGQYSLFIPATSLAQSSGGQPTGDGVVLNKVDDILLRIDYVSVAR